MKKMKKLNSDTKKVVWRSVYFVVGVGSIIGGITAFVITNESRLAKRRIEEDKQKQIEDEQNRIEREKDIEKYTTKLSQPTITVVNDKLSLLKMKLESSPLGIDAEHYWIGLDKKFRRDDWSYEYNKLKGSYFEDEYLVFEIRGVTKPGTYKITKSWVSEEHNNRDIKDVVYTNYDDMSFFTNSQS